MGKKYIGRVSTMIRRKVTQLIIEESNDPRLSEITITDVVVNRDTTRAEIYYSLLGGPEEQAEIQKALSHAAGWMRAELAPSLRLRNVPELLFIYDPSLAHGERIEAILGTWHNEEGQEFSEEDTGNDYEDEEKWLDDGDETA